MNLSALAFPKPTAQVELWFNVIGPELIVAFLLTFGGAELVLSDDPNGKSRIEALIRARLDRLTPVAIAAAIAATFPPERRISLSSLSRWWSKNGKAPRGAISKSWFSTAAPGKGQRLSDLFR